LLRPSPLAPLPLRERGTRIISYSPSPLMGEENNFLLPFSLNGRRGWGMRAI